jgi:hypothetical protein
MEHNMSIKPFSIVMMPDYLSNTTLPAAGITLEVLDKSVGNFTTGEGRDRYPYLNKVFSEKISTNDISDLLAANKLLTSYLLPQVDKMEYRGELSGVGSYIVDELKYATSIYNNIDVNDFIRLYSNPKIDLNTIIMNGDNDHKGIFEFQVTDNTVFIILHSGFTNFILFNISSFKPYFLNRLMSCLVNAFGEETVLNSNFLKSYIRN